MQYKLLGRSGLKVAPICLGTMGFGTENGWGADKKTSKKILETYANAGGNFLDTANFYTRGTSEKFLGEFVKPDRDRFVIATKYSLFENQENVNASGNNRKNMMRTVEASLKRLDTDYIDILYLHIWDNLTPVDEVMRGLDDLVKQGKILYLAISDSPAWVVSKANTMAELTGWIQFIAMQVEYSLLQRSPDREIIPMVKHFDMTLIPWAPLAGGALTGKYLRGEKGRVKPESIRRGEKATMLTKEVIKIAEELNAMPSQVALKWMMQQGFSCIPIAGATRPEQVTENLGALDIMLDDSQLKRLDEISKIDLGFPGAFFQEEAVKKNLYGGFYEKIEQRLFKK
jgi:aryl-alcohol dehydrogenase-like predicted oxidoreductase